MENEVDAEAIMDNVIERGKEETNYDGIKIVEPFATLLGVDENTIVSLCKKTLIDIHFEIPSTHERLFDLTGNAVTLVRNINPNNQEQTFYFTYQTKITSIDYRTVADLNPIRWYIQFVVDGGVLEEVEVDSGHTSYGLEVNCNDDGRVVNGKRKLDEIGWFDEFCSDGWIQWRFTRGRVKKCENI